MASDLVVKQFFTRNAVDAKEVAGDFTTPAEIGLNPYLDMRDFCGLAVLAKTSTLVGLGVASLSIVGNTKSDGSGTDRVIASYSGAPGKALGDQILVEASDEQFTEVGYEYDEELRYASVVLGMDNIGDKAIVVMTRHGPRFARDELTAPIITP